MSTQETLQAVTFKAMGSPCQIRTYARDLQSATAKVAPAIAEIQRLEKKYSRYDRDSYLSKINSAAGCGPIDIDEETLALINYADQAYQQSEGFFDTTTGVLRKVWNFKSDKLPSQKDIDAVLPFIGWHRVEWKPPKLRLPLDMQMDFGGYVKEYAADAAAKVCWDLGLDAGLVELGGDIRVIGPSRENGAWTIGIRDPRETQKPLLHIDLEQGALASSGDYERFLMIDGVRYSHILDPKTGWPVKAPASVSVLGENCLIAGTVSTVAMLRGETGCLDWLDEIGLPYVCIFTDGRVVNKF